MSCDVGDFSAVKHIQKMMENGEGVGNSKYRGLKRSLDYAGRVSYNCAQHKKGCSFRITLFKKRRAKGWKVVRHGLHNHGIIHAVKMSQRHDKMMERLQEMEKKWVAECVEKGDGAYGKEVNVQEESSMIDMVSPSDEKSLEGVPIHGRWDTTAQCKDQVLEEGTELQEGVEQSGEESVEEHLMDEDACEAMIEAMKGYLSGPMDKLKEKELVLSLRCIAEEFFYPLRVIRSQYFGGSCIFVKRLDFECVRVKSCDCPFRVYMRGKFLDVSSCGGVIGSTYMATIFSNKAAHNHSMDEVLLARRLRPSVLERARDMRLKSQLSVADVARVLEDEHGIFIDRATLRRRLQTARERAMTSNKDALKLIEELSGMRSIDDTVHFNFTTSGERNTLCNVWWTFPEWVESYDVYGVVPGVRIDAKEISNVYSVPLATINGRTNSGRSVLFAMAFLEGEREDIMTWFLTEFLRVFGQSPKLVTCDFSYAIINATRNVFPHSLILLDDWHLNDLQQINLTNFLRTVNISGEYESMKTALYSLRYCKTTAQFFSEREAFEEMWFAGGAVPRWFNTLYHNEYNLVAECFNRSQFGVRFFFQGSGYYESSNAEYRRIVNQKRVLLPAVPWEIRRDLRARLAEQRIKDEGVNKAQVSKIASLSGVESVSEAEELCGKLTRYCLLRFLDDIACHVKPWVIKEYRAVGSTQMRNNWNVGKLEFVVHKDSELCTSRRAGTDRTVFLERQSSEPYASDWRPTCGCTVSRTTGIPCVHITAVYCAFPHYSAENYELRQMVGSTSLSFAKLFHVYWHRDPARWREAMQTSRWEMSAEGGDESEDAE